MLELLIDEESRDPRFIGNPFVDSPRYVLGISAIYLSFIFLIGPRFMRDKKPLNVKPWIRVFNTYQILANIFVVISMSYLAFYKLKFSLICEPPDTRMDVDSLRLHTIGYYYLLVRFTDYMDTVFFVLAKKQSHVTFLHVYHHLCVCLNGWLYMRQGWANIGALGGLINACIHTIMYIYFLMATFPHLKKHLWWKKYLTQLQMAQFIAMISQFVVVYSREDHCGYPKAVLLNGIVNVFILFSLFVAFYIKTYIRRSRQPQQPRASSNGISRKRR
ncbi:elongation of very long chain fatty acids protein 4-like [Galendromus occidentalis]|uniref:Elongation of very long chain fatty acids protein n=1 Tax=Galendromus occidentalis TaxID=34638 RepID=A0AAJ6QU97_9ACAR|nr:elongation of very long chain fatty acids protein 4-like [Galendromus occidentalis]